MDDAAVEVSADAQLPMTPMSELLVVDRRSWVAGNVRTIEGLFGEAALAGSDAKAVAWEGGLFLGLLARAVLAQYDPYRDVLIVVYPNLGEFRHTDGLRWLVFHELTHLAQFREAPWMRDYIVETGRKALNVQDTTWVRDAARRMAASLPDLVRWAREVMSGTSERPSPLMDFLPPEQRELILKLHSLLTVLEGHATHVTDVVSARLIPNYEALQERIRKHRRRPPLVRLLEGIGGIEMKRQQYVLGRQFCEAVWKHGGPAALAPAWTGPDAVPTPEELRDPESWLRRVG